MSYYLNEAYKHECIINMNSAVSKQNQLRVVVRSGAFEPLDIEVVRKRIESLCFGLNFDFVNLDLVVHKVQQGVHDLITTIELDNLSA